MRPQRAKRARAGPPKHDRGSERADQRQVTYKIQGLVPHGFVRIAQGSVAKNRAAVFQLTIKVKGVLQLIVFRFRQVLIHEHNRVFKTAAANQAALFQVLHFRQQTECARLGKFLLEFADRIHGCILRPQQRVRVVNHIRNAKLGRHDDNVYRRLLVMVGQRLFEVEIDALGFLLDNLRLAQRFYKWIRTAIQRRRLFVRQLDQKVAGSRSPATAAMTCSTVCTRTFPIPSTVPRAMSVT